MSENELKFKISCEPDVPKIIEMPHPGMMGTCQNDTKVAWGAYCKFNPGQFENVNDNRLNSNE